MNIGEKTEIELSEAEVGQALAQAAVRKKSIPHGSISVSIEIRQSNGATVYITYSGAEHAPGALSVQS